MSGQDYKIVPDIRYSKPPQQRSKVIPVQVCVFVETGSIVVCTATKKYQTKLGQELQNSVRCTVFLASTAEVKSKYSKSVCSYSLCAKVAAGFYLRNVANKRKNIFKQWEFTSRWKKFKK